MDNPKLIFFVILLFTPNYVYSLRIYTDVSFSSLY